MTISIGPVDLAEPVILAPMSGVTDMPFRRLVKRLGAGLVVSEMIASQAMIWGLVADVNKKRARWSASRVCSIKQCVMNTYKHNREYPFNNTARSASRNAANTNHLYSKCVVMV